MKRESSYPWLVFLALSHCSPSTVSYVPKKISALIKSGTDTNTNQNLIPQTVITPAAGSVPVCLPDPNFNKPGFIPVGSCALKSDTDVCPTGFTKQEYLLPENLNSNEQCQLLADNGQRCAPDPKLASSPGGPIGVCLPSNGSCPNLFVLIKSTSHVDSTMGCTYRMDATL